MQTTRMRIGIAGVTGFLGRALGETAAGLGHEIIGFARRAGVSLPFACEMRPLSASGQALDPAGLDALVVLAGESVLAPWTAARRERIRESRIALTERIADAIGSSRERPAVVLSASGTGIYGDRADEALAESARRGSGFLAEVCAGWEAAAMRMADMEIRVGLLRTGMVLGKGGGAWPLLRRIFGLGLGGRLGTGRQWVPWIHLEDEIGIILHALEHGECRGPLNLVSPNPVTNAELTRAVAQALRRPAILPAPAFALRLLMGGMSEILLHSQRVVPEAALRAGYGFKHPDLDAALAALAEFRSP